MCGRFTLYSSPQELQDEFALPIPDYEPSYNIAPTQQVLALPQTKKKRRQASYIGDLFPSGQKRKKSVQK